MLAAFSPSQCQLQPQSRLKAAPASAPQPTPYLLLFPVCRGRSAGRPSSWPGLGQGPALVSLGPLSVKGSLLPLLQQSGRIPREGGVGRCFPEECAQQTSRPWVGLPDLADKNTEFPVKYEFQKHNESFFFKCKYGPCNVWDVLTLKSSFVYLKFRFIWEFYILSDESKWVLSPPLPTDPLTSAFSLSLIFNSNP